jgi:WbqC-like protein family
MIFSSNFLPCVAYMASILNEETIEINASEQYRKQTYKNRAYILGAHKVESLIIPVQHQRNNQLIKETKIDYKENWQKVFWRTILGAYKNSPFFQYYDYLLIPLFEKKVDFLLDYNLLSMSICLKLLSLNKTICQHDYSYFENKNQFLSFNAKNRLDFPAFFNPFSYSQNFGNKFEPNLSVIDLVFCKGPESLSVLKASIVS